MEKRKNTWKDVVLAIGGLLIKLFWLLVVFVGLVILVAKGF